MFFITALDFTQSAHLFEHLQNRGDDILFNAGRRIMKSVREPFSLIVTCDRTELIAETRVSPEVLERSLSVSPINASGCRYSYEGEAAIEHIFLLSSGILSPLFGEDTIQGQIRAAADVSRLLGTSSPSLDRLLRQSVSFSRKIHSSMRVRVIDSTIIDEVSRLTASCGKVLIIGSGEMARMVAEKLKDSHQVTMTLRDEDKTYLVPDGARPLSYEKRLEEAEVSDAIISASSGLYHTLTEGDLNLLRGKLLIDLAEPHDFPDYPSVIRLKDLDVEMPERDEVVQKIFKEAEEEIKEYHAYLERADAFPSIDKEATAVSYEAMRRLSSVISSLSLPPEKERAFRESILDSVHKAYISDAMSRINGKR